MSSDTIRFLREPENSDLPVPAYQTAGAAGFDFRACLPDGPLTFRHGDLELISTGFRVELPPGTEMQIRPRSGLSLKHRFIIPNSPGTVDEDYRGVVRIGLLYLGQEPFPICHGDRIAQGVISRVWRFPIEEAAALSETDRGEGGFGSTGLA
jgi:dUTP pyrophosphatase